MDTKEWWKKTLFEISREIPKTHFLTFFHKTAIIGFEANVLRIGFPTPMAREWVINRYKEQIFSAAQKCVEVPLERVEMEVDGTLAYDDVRTFDLKSFLSEKKVRKLPKKAEVKIEETIPENDNGQINHLPPQSGKKGSQVYLSRLLNPKYRLDNFIIGRDNRLAHAACLAISDRPGGDYNPLFVYGPTGLGKTHLLQATGNEIIKNDNGRIIIYLTGERFMNEVVDAVRKYDIQDFRRRYRQVDCLIIDDIQYIATRERTQEEFFHTFNELYEAGKQVIISSDRPPKELSGIEDRLISRFESGMVVEVCFPDFETRLAILQKKCMDQQVLIPPDVLQFLATNCQTNIRELEGMLNKAVGEARFEGSTPTVRSMARVLKELNKEKKLVGVSEEEVTQKLTVKSAEDLMGLVCEYYRVSKEDLLSVVRKKEILFPRQIAMYLIYEILGHSFDTIGDLFGGKNHTTVMHSYNKVKSMLNCDRKLVADMHALKKEMGL